jgi:hypothetical protein
MRQRRRPLASDEGQAGEPASVFAPPLQRPIPGIECVCAGAAVRAELTTRGRYEWAAPDEKALAERLGIRAERASLLAAMPATPVAFPTAGASAAAVTAARGMRHAPLVVVVR